MKRAILAVHNIAGCGISEITRPGKRTERSKCDAAERDERALDQAIDRKGERWTSVHRPVREAVDRTPIGGQTKLSTAPATMTAKRGDDRHGAFAREEAEIRTAVVFDKIG
jgi:hypothetical protein